MKSFHEILIPSLGRDVTQTMSVFVVNMTRSDIDYVDDEEYSLVQIIFAEDATFLAKKRLAINMVF